MGILYLDGDPVGDRPFRVIGDDGICGPTVFDIAHRDRAPRVTQRIVDDAQAYGERRRLIKLAKAAARLYRKHPHRLNKLGWGMQFVSARRIVEAVNSFREPAPADMNMHGVRIYARWLRRFGDREMVANETMVGLETGDAA